MSIWRIFLNLNLLGQVAAACCKLYWQCGALQIKIKARAPKGNYNLQLSATPDQIT
jgi:hypothetical protein